MQSQKEAHAPNGNGQPEGWPFCITAGKREMRETTSMMLRH
jgi:hypothetical protein